MEFEGTRPGDPTYAKRHTPSGDPNVGSFVTVSGESLEDILLQLENCVYSYWAYGFEDQMNGLEDLNRYLKAHGVDQPIEAVGPSTGPGTWHMIHAGLQAGVLKAVHLRSRDYEVAMQAMRDYYNGVDRTEWTPWGKPEYGDETGNWW